MSVFKIVVPKVGASNKFGTDARLYVADEIVEAKEVWQKDLMATFVANGWAIETKVESVADIETGEPIRARNEQGHYIADDPSTPSKGPPEKKAKKTKRKKRKKTS